tara:strand:- start:380 stop:652 length:273 start_codon:yes stop_codon:yes gene_type:complete
MPAGKHKSGRFRKVFVRTPGSKTVVHHRRRKPGKAKCRDCGKVLAGMVHDLSSKTKNLPKSAKRPERPYGGVLCSKCTRVVMKSKARITE